MAINPIQLFQNPGAPLLEILNGGNNVISGLFDRAIQQGRDSVNNQMRNQSDMLNMRAQETALAQRRGENLQQNWEDVQRESRNAFEFDTKFAAQQGQQALNNNRQGANDLFTQNLQTDTFNLNKTNTEADNARMDSALQLRQDELSANKDFARGVLNQPAPTAETTQPSIKDRVIGWFGGNTAASEPQSDNYFTQIEQARAKQAAAKQLKDPAAYNAAIAEEGAAMQGQMNARTTQKPLTPLQQEGLEMRRRSEGRAIENNQQADAAKSAAEQEKEMKTLVVDTAAFVPQSAVLGEKPSETDTALAKAYDEKKFESEVNSAQNMPLDQYLNMGQTDPAKISQLKLPPAVIAKRQKLWEYANKNKPSGTTPAPTAVRKFNPITGKIE